MLQNPWCCKVLQNQNKRDKVFKSYIWTQYPQGLVRSKMLTYCEGHAKVEVADSDASDGEEAEDEADVVGARSFE